MSAQEKMDFIFDQEQESVRKELWGKAPKVCHTGRRYSDDIIAIAEPKELVKSSYGRASKNVTEPKWGATYASRLLKGKWGLVYKKTRRGQDRLAALWKFNTLLNPAEKPPKDLTTGVQESPQGQHGSNTSAQVPAGSLGQTPQSGPPSDSGTDLISVRFPTRYRNLLSIETQTESPTENIGYLLALYESLLLLRGKKGLPDAIRETRTTKELVDGLLKHFEK